jgi:probable F420-dependent oxidoreductase
MQYGIIYPQTEYGNDPAAIRDFAQTAEELGYTHILIYDHVLGANPDRPGGFHGTYNYQDPFQEPFVLFSYMAAVTREIGFTTGILILPQRQTALVAKQAACLDVLSGGRLRLGIGNGWNKIEYVALNRNFHNRGKRIEEQVEVLRLLWTQPLVKYSGADHAIDDAGLNPLPIQRPIPVWFGGNAKPVLRRAAEMGDGWMPNYRKAEDAKQALEELRGYLIQTHKSTRDFGIEARIYFGEGKSDDWGRAIKAWESAGATHISLNTMRAGLQSPQKHLEAMRRFADDIGL